MRPRDESQYPTKRRAPSGVRGISNLVIGYDGSSGAAAAVAFGLRLASFIDGPATILHAGPTPETVPTGDLLPGSAEQVAAYEREWQRWLQNLREDLAGDAAVECCIVRGGAAGALISAAIAVQADLILVGSHGVGRIRGALLGSVSAQVLTHAPCSVMLFPERSELASDECETIVVGVDGSASSGQALGQAEALANALGATLVLVHAYDTRFPLATTIPAGVSELLQQRGQSLLDAARDTLAAPEQALAEEIEGPAHRVLVDVCKRHSSAVLVVGSRGLGGFEELRLGSTSRRVVNDAPCPVLVARSRHLDDGEA